MTTNAETLTVSERVSVWRISSHSSDGDGKTCVEVGFLGDGRVAVRHSQDPEGPVVVYAAGEWQAFLRGIKDGEFDL